MPTSSNFVSRAGEKLESALCAFAFNAEGLTCADFGSHVGGFVDCLLQRGAAAVYSVDTSYGTFAWKLRKDPRVVVLERTNAMHVELPAAVDLITIDVGWTPQAKILPSAAANLRPEGHVITLIKPHYEAEKKMLVEGVLPDGDYEGVVAEVLDRIRKGGWHVLATHPSPLKGHGGNRELLALLQLDQRRP